MSRPALTLARLALFAGAVIVLTGLTEIGGIVLVAAVLVARRLRGGVGVGALVFVLLYAASSLLLMPPLAAPFGRVPLPCFGSPLRAQAWVCALNRHYVSPRVLALASSMSQAVATRYPGTVIVALDGNFPLFDGVPLLPHLSHDDGLKLDLAYAYATPDGTYLPGQTRSPIGYWAFEQPAGSDTQMCPPGRQLFRWDMGWLQPLFADRPIEPLRTRAMIDWLVSEGPRHGLEKVFLEPYLAKRLGVTSRLVRFQGCEAARHDDHIHLQLSAATPATPALSRPTHRAAAPHPSSAAM